jgi:hypothetical protein
MSSSTWIAVYLPLILMFAIIIPQQVAMRSALRLRISKKKGIDYMNTDVIRKYIGKSCQASTGTYGVKITGTIMSVDDNWIEIQTKKGIELLNAEYVQNIKLK